MQCHKKPKINTHPSVPILPSRPSTLAESAPRCPWSQSADPWEPGAALPPNSWKLSRIEINGFVLLGTLTGIWLLCKATTERGNSPFQHAVAGSKHENANAQKTFLVANSKPLRRSDSHSYDEYIWHFQLYFFRKCQPLLSGFHCETCREMREAQYLHARCYSILASQTSPRLWQLRGLNPTDLEGVAWPTPFSRNKQQSNIL